MNGCEWAIRHSKWFHSSVPTIIRLKQHKQWRFSSDLTCSKLRPYMSVSVSVCVGAWSFVLYSWYLNYIPANRLYRINYTGSIFAMWNSLQNLSLFHKWLGSLLTRELSTELFSPKFHCFYQSIFDGRPIEILWYACMSTHNIHKRIGTHCKNCYLKAIRAERFRAPLEPKRCLSKAIEPHNFLCFSN